MVGQALVAAGKTKPTAFHLHSMHCYFIRAGTDKFKDISQKFRIYAFLFLGNPSLPILYHVERTRDGNSFSSRSVKATQNGDTIFSMMASYHKDEQNDVENQFKMPEVAGPEGLRSVKDWMKLALK